MQTIGDTMTEAEAEKMILQCDKDGSGEVRAAPAKRSGGGLQSQSSQQNMSLDPSMHANPGSTNIRSTSQNVLGTLEHFLINIPKHFFNVRSTGTGIAGPMARWSTGKR